MRFLPCRIFLDLSLLLERIEFEGVVKEISPGMRDEMEEQVKSF
jgi:hypothetical protein